LIQLDSVNKVYDDGFHALKNIDLTFQDAKINVLIGPSGCGKTTTMKLLNRLTTHTDGKVTVNGKDIKDIDTIELRRQTGYVIQNIGLFPHMTIFENVATVPKLLKWDKQKIQKRVKELLEMVNLDPKQYQSRYPSELSGGQQQRIGVIRALAAEPSTVLMDEPFSALDPISREQLQEELIRLQRDIKKTIIFVTHDMDEALKIADHIILMKDGEIVQQGAPEEILTQPKNDFVREFIGVERLHTATPLPPLNTFIQTDFPVVALDDSLEKAIQIMIDHQTSHIAVVDETNVYLGSLTLYTALKKQNEKISDVMMPVEKLYFDDADVTRILHEIDSDNPSFIPIVSKKKKFVGKLEKNQVMKTLHGIYERKNGGS